MPRPWGTNTTITCQRCGKTVTVFPRDIRRGKKFCSEACYWAERSDNRKEPHRQVKRRDRPGSIAEHRQIMIDALGRRLHRWEHVHHIDLNPRNNERGNLVIMSHGDHTKWHAAIQSGRKSID